MKTSQQLQLKVLKMGDTGFQKMGSFFYLASAGLGMYQHLKLKKQEHFLHIDKFAPYGISKG